MSHEPRSRLYLGGNVKIHCVIALAFRLRAGEEKIFSFSAPCVRPSEYFPPARTRVWEGKRGKIAAALSRATHSPESAYHDINLNKYATNSNFIHLLRASFATRSECLFLAGIVESLFLLCIPSAALSEPDHRTPASVCECCCVSFFIFAKIVLKSIHISALWK